MRRSESNVDAERNKQQGKSNEQEGEGFFSVRQSVEAVEIPTFCRWSYVPKLELNGRDVRGW